MNRHDLDWISLIAGLLLATIGLTFLLTDVSVTALDLRWVVPGLLVLAGGGLLLSARHQRDDDTEGA